MAFVTENVQDAGPSGVSDSGGQTRVSNPSVVTRHLRGFTLVS